MPIRNEEGDKVAMMEFSHDTGVNVPTLTMSAIVKASCG